ncbi:MAG: SprB repeat-containing protein [Bacteroidetes bacterium]|nr:SprB repeat-containing protein [Bacteroidota bacterium]
MFGNDGTATITPTGGVGGYTYLWSNSQTTQTATNLFSRHILSCYYRR